MTDVRSKSSTQKGGYIGDFAGVPAPAMFPGLEFVKDSPYGLRSRIRAGR